MRLRALALSTSSLLALGACALGGPSQLPSSTPRSSPEFRLDVSMVQPTRPPSTMREPSAGPTATPSSTTPDPAAAGLRAITSAELPGAVQPADLVALLDAGMGEDPMERSSELRGTWLWTAPPVAPLYLWTVCRGANTDLGTCVLGVGTVGGGAMRLLASKPMGWDVPELELGPDGPRSLVASGGSGRGAMTVPIRITDPAAPAVEFGAERWED